MKRRDLMKRLDQIARERGLEMVLKEGRSHTRVLVGDRRTVVPRHSEINEITAKAILKQIGDDQ